MDGQPEPTRRGLLSTMSSVDALHLAVLAVLVAVSPLVVARTDAGWWLPAGYVALAAVIVGIARAAAARDSGALSRGLHVWYPVAAVLLVFWSLYYVVPGLNGGPLQDDALLALDVQLLGFDPVEAVAAYESPWLTDVMHAFYMAYFVLPVALVAALLNVLCLGFYLCYVGYVLVPATGPRFHVYGSNEMQGVFLTQPARDFIDVLEPNKSDVFPSAHAAITLLANALMLRHVRRLGLALLPLTAGILASLVYARYHYVIDVIAGVGWAAVAFGAGIALDRFWCRRFGPVGGHGG
jgi:membrane-associated phospholipid phosphatase